MYILMMTNSEHDLYYCALIGLWVKDRDVATRYKYHHEAVVSIDDARLCLPEKYKHNHIVVWSI